MRRYVARDATKVYMSTWHEVGGHVVLADQHVESPSLKHYSEMLLCCNPHDLLTISRYLLFMQAYSYRMLAFIK